MINEFPFIGGIDQAGTPEIINGSVSWRALENVRMNQVGALTKRPGFRLFSAATEASGGTIQTAYRMVASNEDIYVLGVSDYGRGMWSVDQASDQLQRFAPWNGVSVRTRRMFPERDMPGGYYPGVTTHIGCAYANGYLAIANEVQIIGGANKELQLFVIDTSTWSLVGTATSSQTTIGGTSLSSTHSASAFTVVYNDTFGNAKATQIEASVAGLAAGWSVPVIIGPVPTSLNVADGGATYGALIVLAYPGTYAVARQPALLGAWASSVFAHVAVEQNVIVRWNSLSSRVGVAIWETNATGQVLFDVIDPGTWAIEATTGLVAGQTGYNTRSLGLQPVTASRWILQISAVEDSFTLGTFLNGETTTICFDHAGAAVAVAKSSICRALVLAGLAEHPHRPGVPGIHVSAHGPAGSKAVHLTRPRDTEWVGEFVPFQLLASLTDVPYNENCSVGPIAVDRSGGMRAYAALMAERPGAYSEPVIVEFEFGSRYMPSHSVPFDADMCYAGPWETPNATVVSAGGGAITYESPSWCFTYAYSDRAGKLRKGGVSLPVPGVNSVNNTLIVSNASLYAQGFRDIERDVTGITLYSTGATANRIPPYMRYYSTLGRPPEVRGATDPGWTLVTPVAGYGSNEQLYSTPGVVGSALDRRPPPAFYCTTRHAGLMIGASNKSVWHSSQPIYGEAQWFSPVFQLEFDDYVTGLASFDGSVVVFTRNEVYMVSCDVPSDNGTVGGWGQPRKLASPVGCVNPRSVCVSGRGVWFESSRGIELLDRAGNVVWIGEQVQDELAARPYIMSAVVDGRNALVRFELAAAWEPYVNPDGVSRNNVSGEGRGLVFDESIGKWISTDTRKNADGALVSATDAAMIYDPLVGAFRYAWLERNGRVYIETDGADDPGAGNQYIPSTAVSAWFRAPLQGGGSLFQGQMELQRVLFLEKQTDAHNLSLELAFNYSDTWEAAATWTDAQIAALALPFVQVEHRPLELDRIMAVRVRIKDAAPSSGAPSAYGGKWLALGFEFKPIEGGNLTPDGAR